MEEEEGQMNVIWLLWFNLFDNSGFYELWNSEPIQSLLMSWGLELLVQCQSGGGNISGSSSRAVKLSTRDFANTIQVTLCQMFICINHAMLFSSLAVWRWRGVYWKHWGCQSTWTPTFPNPCPKCLYLSISHDTLASEIIAIIALFLHDFRHDDSEDKAE